MFPAAHLQSSSTPAKLLPSCNFKPSNPRKIDSSTNLVRLHSVLPFSSLSLRDDCASSPSSLTSSIGTASMAPPMSPVQWNLNQRHILALNAIACVVAVSASWLFFSAIPALLAFKKAAESMEKLLDVTREELPDTMAAVRLTGMEISDLTMELSDLSQDITAGVRSSTRAVRFAEDRLRRLTNVASTTALVQEQTAKKTDSVSPSVARTARSLREGVIRGRSILQSLITFTRISQGMMSFLANRKQKHRI